jgi:large exoprotein involved in heme utilization and adhesion
LPFTPVDVSGLVAQSCSASSKEGSQLAITGRGGLPANPTEVIDSQIMLADLGSTTVKSPSSKVSLPPVKTNTQPPLVEANGWLVNQQGQVMLVPQSPNLTPHSGWLVASGCK